MTIKEFNTVKVGDIVYYYRRVYVEELSTFSASIKSKVITNINQKYDSFIGTHYVDKTSALCQKVIDMRNIILDMPPIHKHDIDFLNYKGPTTEELKSKFNKIINQQNVKPVIDKYPEVFI